MTFKVSFPVRPEEAGVVLGRLARRAAAAGFFGLHFTITAPEAGCLEVEMAWEKDKPPRYAGLKFLKSFWDLMSRLSTTGWVVLLEGPVQDWMTPAPDITVVFGEVS